MFSTKGAGHQVMETTDQCIKDDATRGKRLTAALQNQKKSNKCQTVDVLSLYSTINI